VGIVQLPDGTIYGQGRNAVLAEGVGNNFNFVEFYSDPARLKVIRDIMAVILARTPPKPRHARDTIVVLYGEFCGPKIQKGVAISRLPRRSFFAFAVKVINAVTRKSDWVDLRMLGASIENRELDLYKYACAADLS
jgi:hypothetical protein